MTFVFTILCRYIREEQTISETLKCYVQNAIYKST